MTRDQILTELYNSKDLADCIRKMDPPELHDDIRSELFVVLSELPEDRLVGMWERGELKWYAVRVIVNMVKSGSSGFYRKYRSIMLELSGYDYGEHPDEQRTRKEQEQQLLSDTTNLNQCIDQMYWYDRGIIRLYLQEGSIRKVATKLNIPISSIHETVKRCKEQIRRSIG